MIAKPKSIIFLFVSLLALVYGASYLANILLDFNEKWELATHTFNQLYFFYAVLSTVLFVIHYIVFKKNKEQLGFVFLVTLTIKVVACFLFINEMVNVFEKYYSFSYFFVFLLIDVLLAVRLLNKKE